MPSSRRKRGGALHVSWLCLSTPLAKFIPSPLAPFLILRATVLLQNSFMLVQQITVHVICSGSFTSCRLSP